jgi:hypothetical protein
VTILTVFEQRDWLRIVQALLRARHLEAQNEELTAAPLGMRCQLEAAAATENISIGEFVRRSLESAILA